MHLLEFTNDEGFPNIEFPHKKIISLQNKRELATIGGYIVPHACAWIYSKLKLPLNTATTVHELGHISQRGIPFVENLKVQCLNRSSCLKKMKYAGIMERQIEGLATANSFLHSKSFPKWVTLESFRDIISTSPFITVFLDLGWFIFERSENIQFIDLMTRIYFSSCFVYDLKKNEQITPLEVVYELSKKIKEKNPTRINWKTFREVVTEIFREIGWIEGSPRHIRTFFSIIWAVVSTEAKSVEVSRIAIRNFFESLFWIPINVWFSVDTDSFSAKKIPLTEALLEFYGKPSPTTPLGQYISEYTERILLSVNKMKHKPSDEENFIFHFLPDIASACVQGLVDDYKSDNPKLLSNKEWKAIGNLPPDYRSLCKSNSSIRSFLNSYEKEQFLETLKELMMGSLEFPEDCIHIVERHAERTFGDLGDAAKIMFQ